jgi:hypothetical protein
MEYMYGYLMTFSPPSFPSSPDDDDDDDDDDNDDDAVSPTSNPSLTLNPIQSESQPQRLENPKHNRCPKTTKRKSIPVREIRPKLPKTGK